MFTSICRRAFQNDWVHRSQELKKQPVGSSIWALFSVRYDNIRKMPAAAAHCPEAFREVSRPFIHISEKASRLFSCVLSRRAMPQDASRVIEKRLSIRFAIGGFPKLRRKAVTKSQFYLIELNRI